MLDSAMLPKQISGTAAFFAGGISCKMREATRGRGILASAKIAGTSANNAEIYADGGSAGYVGVVGGLLQGVDSG